MTPRDQWLAAQARRRAIDVIFSAHRLMGTLPSEAEYEEAEASRVALLAADRALAKEREQGARPYVRPSGDVIVAVWPTREQLVEECARVGCAASGDTWYLWLSAGVERMLQEGECSNPLCRYCPAVLAHARKVGLLPASDTTAPARVELVAYEDEPVQYGMSGRTLARHFGGE